MVVIQKTGAEIDRIPSAYHEAFRQPRAVLGVGVYWLKYEREHDIICPRGNRMWYRANSRPTRNIQPFYLSAAAASATVSA